jgi:protein involved in polysaccharide export with SLBB domain
LKDGYVLNPEVSVSISEFRPIFVVGEVKTPGKKSYTNKMTVRKAIVLAGGLTDRANVDNITIERTSKPGQFLSVTEVNSVEPGDIIHIGEKESFTIRGMVELPDDYFYKSNLSIRSALTLAGGLKESGNVEDIVLERDGKLYNIFKELDTLEVRPKDIITIGSLSIKEKEEEEEEEEEEEQLFFFVQGEVRSSGRYDFVKGMNVEKAIVFAGGFSKRASKKKVSISREGEPPLELRRVELSAPVLAGDVITVGVSFF